MSNINNIFEKIETLTRKDGQSEFIAVFVSESIRNDQITNVHPENITSYHLLKSFLEKIFQSIDELAHEIKNDDKILISVKNQKLLRTCYQLIASLGISICLIPGLGLNLSKRCSTASFLPSLKLSDDEKYDLLIECAQFFTRSYEIPVLKNIIMTLHLSDYLAALIQLSFAPLKKPGQYKNYIMTEDKFEKLNKDRHTFLNTYNHLVKNCFQPTLMKELLVLQSVTEPPPPAFVKRVISKEMSQQLLVPGGLLSLIRCFIENYNVDTGFEWRKIDMICRIVSAKHGTDSEIDYLKNISGQLKKILLLNNTHYLATAVACVLSLNENYPECEPVQSLVKDIFQSLDYNNLLANALPGTVILSPQEVEHKINVIHACVCTTKLDWPITLLLPNINTLLLIGSNSSKNEELKTKTKDILLKYFEKLSRDEVLALIKNLMQQHNDKCIQVEEYDAGIMIKCVGTKIHDKANTTILYFITLVMAATDTQFIQNVFEISLEILIELSMKRKNQTRNDLLLTLEDEPTIDNVLNYVDEQYITILQLLSEISTSPKIITLLKTNHLSVIKFIEHFILTENYNSDDECTTIALVLLNTILSNSNRSGDFHDRFSKLIPVLKKYSADETSLKHILSKEALSLILSDKISHVETKCGKAISDVFDHLLPVRAHGIIELTKLIENKDEETISKKHYIFCLFQEQLKDPDSYIYLSAINGLASLCNHCTEDVLHILCKEFLDISTKRNHIETAKKLNNIAELRMKIGDIIVKVTKKLGEMAVVHKTILLNTMLCACRDDDPMIRTSALSNLAEIALVLHYKIGSIIYEVLLCIWSIIETDKAVECRRAAVMIITSLIKGLGKETLVQLKEDLLPIYRTLKNLHRNENEDAVVKLHAQLALEELNDVVNQFLFPEVKMEKQIFVLDKPENVFK